ncbi:IclR family transcriptional regulator [Shimia biformata]|uniref:IclR family transcriptional regulator n=1 Tax=Shimia biformata TaxID=1294299 RepID=UPI00194F8C18|nr:IclR family transcriptional regulator [Shimia biformata]
MRKRTETPTDTDSGTGGVDDRQFITALHRGLEVLRAFRPDDHAGLSNGDLSERTGLPNSTISRLTYTLLKSGYLIYDTDTGRYRMGVPVLSLGYACLSGLTVREAAQNYMRELASHCGEGVQVALGGRVDYTMIYLATARSRGVISLQLDVGSRISLARSAMGRAYIAAAEPEERDEILAAVEENAGPEKWPELKAGIDQAAEEIATRGFYANLGDWQPHVHSVAVPFRSHQRDVPLMAFNLGGPSNYLPKEKLIEDFGPRLRDLASMLTKSTI